MPVDGRAGTLRARLWRALTYLDPAQPGFLERMVRVVAGVVALGACAALAAALALMGNERGRYWTMVALTLGGENELALPIAQELVDDHPGERWDYYRFEAMNLRRMGRIADSLSVYEEAVRALPDEWWAHSHTCFYNALYGNAAAVLDDCDRSIALGPDQPDTAHDRRAIARALAGDRAGAIADFEVAMDIWRQGDGDDWRIESRTRWLEALRAGDDPLGPAELAEEQSHY